MLSSASTRRNKPSSTSRSATTRGGRDTMTSKTESGFAPSSGKRKLRTRDAKHRMQRRQNLVLGIFVFTMTLVFIAIGVSVNSSANAINQVNTNSDHFDKNLRGGAEERSIWVSQKSQPFVSVCNLIFMQQQEKWSMLPVFYCGTGCLSCHR